MLAALVGISYGLASMAPLELKVLHARQPLFVLQSDGTIQNSLVLAGLMRVLDLRSSDL